MSDYRDCDHNFIFHWTDGKTKQCKCGATMKMTEHVIESPETGEAWRVWKIEPPVVIRVTV